MKYVKQLSFLVIVCVLTAIVLKVGTMGRRTVKNDITSVVFSNDIEQSNSTVTVNIYGKDTRTFHIAREDIIYIKRAAEEYTVPQIVYTFSKDRSQLVKMDIYLWKDKR